jgi:hypothetical protein
MKIELDDNIVFVFGLIAITVIIVVSIVYGTI